MQLVHLVILPQVLSNFCVAMLIVRHDDFAAVSRCNSSLAIELSRKIALPIFLVLANVLNAEREAVVNEEWFAFER